MKHLSATLGVLLCLLPRSGRAADVTVTVSAGAVKKIIDGRITTQLIASTEAFGWREGSTKHVKTTTSPAGDDMMHVALDLATEVPFWNGYLPVPVLVSFDLLFECDSSGVHISLHDTEINLGSFSPGPELVEQIEDDANQLLDEASGGILADLWAKLKMLDSLPGLQRVCPHFEVQKNGGLIAEADFQNGCINGRRSHRACVGNSTGPGVTRHCVNGRWSAPSGHCTWPEPTPPPGGHPL